MSKPDVGLSIPSHVWQHILDKTGEYKRGVVPSGLDLVVGVSLGAIGRSF
jgi:hypothetical protein